MEQSAFEALMIGVNVFVFIIALSAGMFLMTSVLDMAEYANTSAITGMNGSLADSVGDVHERTYSGNQLLSYYRRVMQGGQSKYNFMIKLSNIGTEKTLKSYVETESIYNYMDSEFELQYKGVVNNKETYIFVLMED